MAIIAECFNFWMPNMLYTSSRNPIEIPESVYKPIYIKRSGIRNEEDLFKTSLEVTVAAENPVAQQFNTWIDMPIYLTVIRCNLETDPMEHHVIWDGRITSVKFKGDEAILHGETVYTSLRKKGLRRVFQRTCPYILFDPNSCRVPKSNWSFTQTITGFSSGNSTIAHDGNFPVNYFKGGYVTLNTYENRLIVSSTANSIEVQSVPNLTIGDNLVLQIGCDRSYDMCNSRFNNTENYGGQTHIPHKNLFSSDLYA